MKNILVTGGGGFLGSHLCGRLLEEGNRVLCVDNFLTGTRGNVDAMLSHPDFKVMEHDICSPIPAKILEGGGIHEIYNLACPASPLHYQKHPIETIRTNVEGSIRMLELARKTKARILQASTSEVYGDPAVHPQPESYWGAVNPIGPRACYDEGKRCAETLFFDYHRKYRLPIKVVRIFNTYGPRMQPDDGRVVSNFIVQALKNEDITIYGQGDQTRSFCYVDDLIDGLLRMMTTDEKTTGPVNLGNPVEMTVRELAETILRLTGSRSRLVFKPLPVDDPCRRNPDITQARERLSWSPRVSLEEGLKKTIAYFRK